ncbi:MAG: hypothetical protein A2Y77_14225 [Planctomycetes bacterium RBG_13_62_9]|nr:MAG: hypothetical protein A2Y77_14225 [Planctomycetes bacterium RBG_13_62_9]
MALPVSQVLQEWIIGKTQSIPAPLSVSRIAAIDRLRILAVIGIVWFHAEEAPYRLISYTGLPVFLLIFFSLVVKRGCADTTTHFLKRRWDRLMMPWLFWCVLYALCKLAKAACIMDLSSLYGLFSVKTLVVGTNPHLWYLPFAFLSGILVHVLNGRTLRVNNTMVIVTATIVGVFALVPHAIGISGPPLTEPLPQWRFGLAAIPLGFAVGRCLLMPSGETQRMLLSVVSAITVGGCVVLYSLGFASPAVPYGLAMLLVCLAYGWQAKDRVFFSAAAPLTFGIYLIHPLVAYGLKQLVVPSQHFVAFVALTVCISGLLTLSLVNTRLRRFV